MGIVSGLVVYFLIWWLVIFTVLPRGIERHGGEVAGVDPGAPRSADMKRKLLITTIVSAVIWLVVYGVIASDLISFRQMSEGMK